MILYFSILILIVIIAGVVKTLPSQHKIKVTLLCVVLHINIFQFIHLCTDIKYILIA